MKLLRKLTIKTCGDFRIARIKKLLIEAHGAKDAEGNDIDPVDGASVELLKIAGEVVRAKSGQTDKGSYTRLDGQFIGTDLTTGELYQSGACILPEFVGAQLGAAVLGANGGAVQFAFKISAKWQANAITQYEYEVESLMESKPTDSMARLLALAGIDASAKPKQLQAPAPTEPAAEPAAPPAAPAAEPAKPAAKSAGKK